MSVTCPKGQGWYVINNNEYCSLCNACGSYSDTEDQSPCKTATVETCRTVKANSVPTRKGGGRTSLEDACELVPRGAYYWEYESCFYVSACKGCGLYQDEQGMDSCKTATLEVCQTEDPSLVPQDAEGAITVKDACREVPKGFYYGFIEDRCYYSLPCDKCGEYQDEVGRDFCKVATVTSCRNVQENSVPAGKSSDGGRTNLSDACQEVPKGYYYYDYEGCFYQRKCGGDGTSNCGIYQDEPGQKSCKVASLVDCKNVDASLVPRGSTEGVTSIEEACQVVPEGYRYNKNGNNDCYFVTKCGGDSDDKDCGVYQDEKGQDKCKIATLEDCKVIDQSLVPRGSTSGVTSLEKACQVVPEGHYYYQAPWSSPSCYKVADCGGDKDECGLYQDERGQDSCKTASVEDCQAIDTSLVPKSQTRGATTVEETCQVIPKGYHYTYFSWKCYEKFPCDGCGEYQDEEGQEFCKVASVESCQEMKAGSVPNESNPPYQGRERLEDACTVVEKGYYYHFGYDDNICPNIRRCSDCGAYTDAIGQSECKVSTLRQCQSGEGRGGIPIQYENSYSSPPPPLRTSLQEACVEVPTGNYYEQDEDKRCYTSRPCVGCGLYQDETNQSSCKRKTCTGSGAVQQFSVGAEDDNGLCINKDDVSAGQYIETVDDDETLCAMNCTGCGLYQSSTGQDACEVADCPAGEYPILNSGATSIEEACAPLPEIYYDLGFDFEFLFIHEESQCAFNSCYNPYTRPEWLGVRCNYLKDLLNLTMSDPPIDCSSRQFGPDFNAGGVQWKDILEYFENANDVNPVCQPEGEILDGVTIGECSCSGRTLFPTNSPSVGPSVEPSVLASMEPSVNPSVGPTVGPSEEPSEEPNPLLPPSSSPTNIPTLNPTTTSMPTPNPTPAPFFSFLPVIKTAVPLETTPPTPGPTPAPYVTLGPLEPQPSASPSISAAPVSRPTSAAQNAFISAPLIG
eukprot:CAMPEP_0194212488 /NCGR_PEP_ID=MMETSP0156-20130528/12439_1 /TAXON_ID=33649 /ORGANISM="Thalassionema nitzschioides, Strain L26-B" /LENGTH=963 /DNA_ID=CAMNT_0038940327 /DNA_START=150 /DNA_END=3038 /DNA_ORIENTATION=-